MAANAFDDRIRFGSLYEIYGALLTGEAAAILDSAAKKRKDTGQPDDPGHRL